MSIYEKTINKLIISLLFTIMNWIIINNFIVEIIYWKYLFIEILLVVSMKLSIFTTRKLKL